MLAGEAGPCDAVGVVGFSLEQAVAVRAQEALGAHGLVDAAEHQARVEALRTATAHLALIT